MSQTTLQLSGPDRAWSVTEVTRRIRTILDRETALQNVWVSGEVSNLRRPSSGHIYFTLKDAGAQLACVIWKSQIKANTVLPRDGDQMVTHGKISLYEPDGRYQLYVDWFQTAGRGQLNQEFERLKARLEAEGLFAAERKQPSPAYPHHIGVVTSPSAAALRDVLQILRSRYPLADVLLSPTSVQGEDAPPQIVAALTALDAREDIDVILVVRGGGSLEDLWAFNDERVVRAVAAARHPVISGVGHEIDFTLCDFAADVRAPTPTAAAQLATPDRIELQAQLFAVQSRLETEFEQRWRILREQVVRMERTLDHLAPQMRLANSRQRVDDLAERAGRACENRLVLERQRLESITARLEALNPEAVLRRGYAMVRAEADGALVTMVAAAVPGSRLVIRWQDGEARVRVE